MTVTVKETQFVLNTVSPQLFQEYLIQMRRLQPSHSVAAAVLVTKNLWNNNHEEWGTVTEGAIFLKKGLV